MQPKLELGQGTTHFDKDEIQILSLCSHPDPSTPFPTLAPPNCLREKPKQQVILCVNTEGIPEQEIYFAGKKISTVSSP